MACGTGKTRTTLEVARRLIGSGDVVVLACPSISLPAQALEVWRRHAPGWRAIAVCSDGTVSDASTRVEDRCCGQGEEDSGESVCRGGDAGAGVEGRRCVSTRAGSGLLADGWRGSPDYQ
ncbi:DEAD/DEAH box helicase family protein [Amycolatopsis sp. EV170708-02-1]|uniref:DEAD/DEAH box helicase family protein n=1 Tax=Amycolatopsis sp. EV170708-02-1 TaxID=2919322 RepID=UPI0037BE32A5